MTRPGVRVDRMASAWLIRKFIDPAATFVFAESSDPAPADVVRFDMYEGDFTHDGDRCTFEVLLRRAGVRDRGLTAIAEMVHDLDIKDDKYQRPETAGLAAMLEGIVAIDRFNGTDTGSLIWDAIEVRHAAMLRG